MADVGETRTYNGETRTWDGSAWRLASETSSSASRALKDYATELATGKGNARAEVADYGKKELSGFLSGLNPINQVEGIKNLVLHPIDTASNLIDTGHAVLNGDPTAVGNALSMIVAPKLAGAELRGVNKAASAVAENPSVRNAIGYVTGAGGAMATVGHPFIGAAVGRIMSPLMKAPAAEVANASGWLMDKLGMTPSGSTPAESAAPTATSGGGFTPAERASLVKQGFSPETITKIEAQGKVTSPQPTPFSDNWQQRAGIKPTPQPSPKVPMAQPTSTEGSPPLSGPQWPEMEGQIATKAPITPPSQFGENLMLARRLQNEGYGDAAIQKITGVSPKLLSSRAVDALNPDAVRQAMLDQLGSSK